MVVTDDIESSLEEACDKVDGRSVDLHESVRLLSADLITGLGNIDARLARMEAKLTAILIVVIVMGGSIWATLIVLIAMLWLNL